MGQLENLADYDDQKLVQQYSWSAYKELPPIMANDIEVALLRKVCKNKLTPEQCGQLLEEPGFQRTFLRCWDLGTFDELRAHAKFPYEEKLYLVDSEHLASPLPSTGLSSTTEEHMVVANSTFYTVGGDVWNIHYSMSQAYDISFNYPTIHHADDRQIILAEWLCDVDQRARHNSVVKKRAPNTGHWFLASPELTEFCQIQNLKFESAKRVLWCPGIPGVGKTVIASLAIDFLRRLHENAFVGFIYFDFKFRTLQDLTYVLNSLCRQVFETFELDRVSTIFENLYDGHRPQKTRPSVTELRHSLSSAFQMFKCCFIVLDGLDEYLDQYSDAGIRELLENLISLGAHVKLMVTSRFLTGLTDLFEYLGSSRKEIEATDEDICSYVERRLDGYQFNFEIPLLLREHIIEGIRAIAGGRFLMAELNMNLLSEQLNPGDLEDTLHALPNEEDAAYSRVMERIGRYTGNRGIIARKAILLVASTFRPLSIEEFRHALAAKEGRYDVNNYLTPLSTITAACLGVLVVRDNKVVFTHFTAQEYFDKEQTKILYFPHANTEIAQISLDYLSLGILSDDSLANEFPSQICRLLPFYNYAALNWGLHINKNASKDAIDLSSRVWHFLTENHQAAVHCATYLLWDSKQWTNAAYVPKYHDTKLSSGASLFIAVHHNQMSVIHRLLEDIEELPRTQHAGNLGDIWRTPLWFVTRADQTQVVEAMINKFGGEVYAANDMLLLRRVVQCGLTEAVEHILAHPDMDLCILCMLELEVDGKTLLHEAATFGHVSVVRLLLQYEAYARANTTPHHSESAAQLVCESEYFPISQSDCLVTPSWSLPKDDGPTTVPNNNLNSDSHRRALIAAIVGGNSGVVALMLEAGISPNFCSAEGHTPLFMAAADKNAEMLDLIIKHGGSTTINITDNEGRSPLSEAAGGFGWWQTTTEEQAELCVRLLLQHTSTDIHLLDEKGRSPLYYAYRAGHTRRIVPLLEYNGAQLMPNAAETPPDFLCTAARDGMRSVVELFLKRLKTGGITAEPRDADGATALSFAAGGGHLDIVDLLLNEHWVDVNSQDEQGRTALAYALFGSHFPIIDRLLQHSSIDVTSRDEEGACYLTNLIKARMDSEPLPPEALGLLVNLLSKYPVFGGMVNDQDTHGNTAVSYSAARSWQYLQILLAVRGVNPNIQNHSGQTPLMLACRSLVPVISLAGNRTLIGRESAVAINILLRNPSVTVNSQDNSGRTALSWAIWHQEKQELAHPRLLICKSEWRVLDEDDVERKVSALLSRAELDLNLPDNEGRTPLWYVRQLGYSKVAKMLVVRGARE